MRRNTPPDIFSYTDHRKLLKDLYAFNKGLNRRFTYRFFSEKVGLSSPSMLKDVIAGRKNITLRSIRRFTAPFNLTQKQSDYFEVLVHFNLAKNRDDRRKIFSELIKFQRTPRAKKITPKEYKIYDEWYYLAVRGLVGLRNFKNDPRWIAKKVSPAITPAQAQKALDLLLKLGFITKDKAGNLKQDVPKWSVDPEAKIKAVTDLTQRMIELEWESIGKFSAENRERLGIVMDMPRSCFEDVKRMIRKYQEEILDYVSKHTDKSDVVCHLGFGLYPLISDFERVEKKKK